MEQYHTVFIKMPSKVHGTHCVNPDGSVTVFINQDDPWDVQQKAYLHEYFHIINNDLSLKDISCERRAHAETSIGIVS